MLQMVRELYRLLLPSFSQNSKMLTRFSKTPHYETKIHSPILKLLHADGYSCVHFCEDMCMSCFFSVLFYTLGPILITFS